MRTRLDMTDEVSKYERGICRFQVSMRVGFSPDSIDIISCVVTVTIHTSTSRKDSVMYHGDQVTVPDSPIYSALKHLSIQE